jgi:hypothetical protein
VVAGITGLRQVQPVALVQRAGALRLRDLDLGLGRGGADADAVHPGVAAQRDLHARPVAGQRRPQAHATALHLQAADRRHGGAVECAG